MPFLSAIKCSSIKLLIALTLLLGSVSAFNVSHLPTTLIQPRSHELYAKKPTRMSGIGGMPSSRMNSKTNSSKVSNVKSKPSKNNGTSKSVFDRPKLSNETPWASILVAFLNPLRNPNSLFLYLLVIVSVLGKLNENNVAN